MKKSKTKKAPVNNETLLVDGKLSMPANLASIELEGEQSVKQGTTYIDQQFITDFSKRIYKDAMQDIAKDKKRE